MVYRSDIDGLRAVAVLSVILYHGNEEWLPGGFVGVDIFFVISGFLICRIIRDELAAGKFSILGFYERRARRILPALLAVIFVSLVLGYWLLLPSDFLSLGESAISSTLFVSNFYFLTEVDYFAAPLESYPLLHLWSLAVEEQFYIVTPLLMMLIFRYWPRSLVPALAILSVLSLCFAVALVVAFPKASFYMLPPRFWELGIGAALGISRVQMPNHTVAHAASVAGAIFIGSSLILLSSGPPFPGVLAVPTVLGAAMLIWAGPNGFANKLLSLRPFVWVGLVSYSLYLWHWPILSFLKYVTIGELDALQVCFALLFSLIMAVLSYRFIEQPFRKKSNLLSRNRVLLASTTALIIGVALGSVPVVTSGMPGRWQENSLQVLTSHHLTNWQHDLACRNFRTPLLEIGEACVVGDSETEFDFIVWGDSHAAATKVGFARYAKETDTSGLIISLNGCAPLLGWNNRSLPAWRSCIIHNRNVLKYLMSVDVKPIILVSRWTSERDYVHFFNGESVPILERLVRGLSEGSLKKSVERTVAELEKQEKRVFWLKTVPGQRFHVPSAMAKSIEWDQILPSVRKREEYAEIHSRIDEIFDAFPEISSIPVIDTFCDGEVCAAQKDGIALYFDDHHLSNFGSNLLTRALKENLHLDSLRAGK